MSDSMLNVIVKLSDQASGGLNSLSKKFDSMGDGIDKSTEKAQTFTKVVTAVWLAAWTYAVAKFAEFEKWMSAVKAAVAPTAAEFSKLGDLATKIGVDTQYTQVEIAGMMEEMGKQWLKAQEILDGAATAAANLAQSTGWSLENSATAMADAMKNFKLSGKDMTATINEITGFANESKFSLEDFQLALAQGWWVAAQSGIDFLDFTASLTAVSQGFASGSDAGTSFKTFIQRLSAPTNKAQELMDKLGISAYDSSGKMKSMSAIAQNLQDSLKGMTQEQKNFIITQLFGADSSRIAGALMEKWAAGIDEYRKKLQETNAAQQAAVRMDNLAGDWQLFTGSVDMAVVSIGKWITTSVGLRPIVQEMNTIINDMGGFWNSLSPAMQQSIIVIGAVTAALAGLVFVVWAIGIALPAILTWLSAVTAALAFLVSPIGLVITAIAALGIAYATNFGGFKDAVNSAWAAIQPIFMSIISGIVDLAGKIGTYLDQIKGPMIAIWNEISPYVMEFLTLISGYFSTQFGIIISMLQGAWDVIKGVFGLAIDIIGGALSIFLNLITWNWSGAWEALKTMTIGVWEDLKLIFSGAFTIIGGAIQLWWNTVKLYFSTAWIAIKGIVSTGWDMVKWAFSAGLDLVYGLVTWGIDLWNKSFDGFGSAFKNVMSAAWEGVKNMFASGINWVIDKINSAIDALNVAAWAVGMKINKIPPLHFQNWGIAQAWQWFKTGGIISGGKNPANHDQIPAMLDPGELILNRAQQSNVAQALTTPNANGGTNLTIQVSGNSFYGSDSDFAEKIGDAIFAKFNQHIAINAF